MPKLPRDISCAEFARLLKKYDYKITRQTGNYIRLTSKYTKEEHRITIPSHFPSKIGTLSNILGEISNHLGITKQELMKSLFEGK